MESEKGHCIEDWYPDTCAVCGAPSYIGAGIKSPQCSSPECVLYKALSTEKWKEKEKQRKKEDQERNGGHLRPNDDGICFLESEIPDDLYFHDDED